MNDTDPRLHDEAAVRLAALEQRYTSGRRAIVTALTGAARPLTVPQILEAVGASLPQSSAYRNLTVLVDAGVVRRVAAVDDHGRYELAEDLSGHHHHHLICSQCGTVADITAQPKLERALAEAARLAADDSGYEITDHRIDLVGRCADCR